MLAIRSQNLTQKCAKQGTSNLLKFASMTVQAFPKQLHPSSPTWTVEDFNVCVNLVHKARQHGAFQAVMERVQALEQSTSSETGLVVSSMTDASKRRCEEEPPREVVVPYSSGYSGGSGMSSNPMPKSGSPVSMMMPSPEDEELPPGIVSVEHWGRCLVPFGKFENRKVYREIAFGHSEEIRSYRSYLFAHFSSGSAKLRDLVLYMKAAGVDADEGAKIPGTSVTQKFA